MFPSFHSPRSCRALLRVSLFLLVLVAVLPRLSAQTPSQFYSQGVDAYNRGDAATARQKLDLALRVDKNFRPATLLLQRMAEEQRQAAAPVRPGMSAKALQATTVPVEFKDTTLTAALDYIRQKALEDSGGQVVINFAVNLPPELANKPVTIKMEHVPVMELLRYMGEQAGVSFTRQPYAIVVTPGASKPAVGSAAGGSVPAS